MKRVILISFAILMIMISSMNVLANEINNVDVPLPFNFKISVVSNEKGSTVLIEGKGKVKICTVLYKYAFKALNGKIIDFYCHDVLFYTDGKIDSSTMEDGIPLIIKDYKGYKYTYGLMYTGGLFEEGVKVNSTTANYIIDLGENNINPQSYFTEKSENILQQLIDGSSITDINGVTGVYDTNLTDIDKNGDFIPKNKVYDLEIPLNVNVDVSGKKTTITWEQSDDIDVKGWETEIYVNQTGYTKKEFWSKKIKYDSNWLFADEVLNYYKRYSYNGIMLPVVNDYLQNKLGYDPHVKKVSKSNFMIRNKFVDEAAGVTHYSNFVKFDQDGNAYVYYATEVSSKELQELIDSGADITSSNVDSAIDTNSENYNGEQTSSFNQATKIDVVEFFNKCTDMIGDIPNVFNKIFSFLPSLCIFFIGIGMGVVVILRIFGR